MAQTLYLLDGDGKIVGTIHARVPGDPEQTIEIGMRSMCPGLTLAEDVAQPPVWFDPGYNIGCGSFAVRTDEFPVGVGNSGPNGAPAVIVAVHQINQTFYEIKTPFEPQVGHTLTYSAHSQGGYAGIKQRTILEVRDASQPVPNGPWYSKVRLDTFFPSSVGVDAVLNYVS